MPAAPDVSQSSPPTHAFRRAPLWVAVTLTLLLIVLWLVWFAVARSRLNAQLAAVRARGETLDPKELVWHPLPTTRPEATYFHQALAAVSAAQTPPPSEDPATNQLQPPYPPEWHAVAEHCVTANAAALAMARQARDFRESTWTFNDLNPSRELAIVIGDAAVHAHAEGDDAEALERVLDVRHLAWCMERDMETIPYLVALGIEALANERLALIASGIRFDDDHRPRQQSPTTRPASRAEFAALVPELLDDQSMRNRIRFLLLRIRDEEYQVLGRAHDTLTVLRPMADLDAARVLDDYTACLRGAAEPTLPAALAVTAGRTNTRSGLFQGSDDPPRYSRLIYSNFHKNSLIEMQWIVIANRRLLATDLAVQLFRADHDRWPESLDELVPRYLPSVPTDPLDARGAPIKYVVLSRDGAPRPLLGLSATAGRPDTPPSTQPMFSSGGYDSQWVDLSLPETPTPATTRSAADR